MLFDNKKNDEKVSPKTERFLDNFPKIKENVLYNVSGYSKIGGKNTYDAVFAPDPHTAVILTASHHGYFAPAFVEESEMRSDETASISAYINDDLVVSFYAVESEKSTALS